MISCNDLATNFDDSNQAKSIITEKTKVVLNVQIISVFLKKRFFFKSQKFEFLIFKRFQFIKRVRKYSNLKYYM